MPLIKCEQCGTEFKVVQARANIARFCSVRCRSDWRRVHFVGSGNPKWAGGERIKHCQQCGVKIVQGKTEAISTYRKRKFCSNACAKIGQVRYTGEQHPRFKEDSRRRTARKNGKEYVAWQTAVFTRDSMTCQHCGATGIQMHAHHIKAWAQHPESRFDVSNGITLCHRCHWLAHSAHNENPVNSVNTRLAKSDAKGNTEPSSNRKVLEGVTTRGRPYRRIETTCAQCGNFITRTFGQAKNRAHLFCNMKCMRQYFATYRSRTPKGVISSTSAGAVKARDSLNCMETCRVPR